MNIAKPEMQDLKDVWELIRLLNLVSYELNPLKPCGEDDFEDLEDGDAAAVLAAIVEAYENSNVQWLMTVLETLLSPKNGLIDQESDTLAFNPRLKGAIERIRQEAES